METELFSRFAPVIRSMSIAELDREIEAPSSLRLETARVGSKIVEVAYAPFDFINLQARIVIVGLTPGRQQMRNALHEARRLLLSGSSTAAALEGAKVFASFSGAMRTNLVDLLDFVGVPQVLGLSTSASLWNGDARIVHFMSALRYPVFVDGKNYSGSPDMLKTPMLAGQLRRWFGAEMAALPNALFVPLGPNVGVALEAIAREAGVGLDRVLSGLPHPSGANAEGIAYFLGRKPRNALSVKRNPDKLDAMREKLVRQLGSLR